MEASLNSVITNALFSLYGNGFMENFYNMIRSIMDATEKTIENSNLIQGSFVALSGITAALVIIFFLFELIGRFTDETYTAQQTMVLFAKMITAIFFCIAMPQICSLVIKLGIWLLDITESVWDDITSSSNLVAFVPDDKYEFVEYMDIAFPGGSSDATLVQEIAMSIEHPRWALESMIVLIMTAALNIVGYAFGIYTAIVLIVRLYFAPIGVVNLYRGMQSSGMRYFKSLLTTAFTFPAMLAVVAAASVLGKGLIQSDIFTTIGLIDTDEYGNILDETDQLPVLTIDIMSSAEEINELNEKKEQNEEAPVNYWENTNNYNENYNLYFREYIQSKASGSSLSYPDSDTGSQDVSAADYALVNSGAEDAWRLSGQNEARQHWDSAAETGSVDNVSYDDWNTFYEAYYNFFYTSYVEGNGDSAGVAKNARIYATSVASGIMQGDIETKGQQLQSDQTAEYDAELYSLQQAIELEFLFALNFRTIIAAIVPQIAAIAGMMGASRLIRSVLDII